MAKPADELTRRQRAFIDEYFLCNMKGAEAARRLGSKQPRLYAHRMITNDNVSAEIERRLKEKHLSADEVLAWLGDIARSDIADFAKVRKVSDLEKEEYRGKTHVIKKFKTKIIIDALGRQVEQVELELHDAQAVLIHLDKRTSPDGSDDRPIVVKVLKGLPE